ncbi:mirror-image polydactyly gene 1 protein isoform X2 [Anser cygnoides]|uniref:mirror-image polydactyly gene 1 protein isoform X2 n=1 Tax=Anser cygnoides TaxID=8845 RepID=UPI0020097C2F|nr:mirror-image polydactyly gene 1 protein isoform X3 [Anser cygnoides]XP_047915827.1 mirror-image polydactyly gene 1 protein isoform X3 [Anser cygnoides]
MLEEKLESVPDQTSSEEQMENSSKEIRILEQKREDFCAEFQLHQNSSKKPEFFIQAEAEALKLSDLVITSQRKGPSNMYGDCNSSPGELSTIEEKGKRMLPEFISSWKDGTGVGGKTETAFLLKELDTLRAKNKKLQDKLSEKDKELKTIKLDLELQERATEAKIAEKIAALVEEVYSAQRERDEAVMARLRLANEERDEAFLRVQRLEESLKELENINPEENDMTLQELLNRINNADTGIDILKNGAIILNRIHRTKERKKKIIAEEMTAVIEQRDAALSQCKRLEQELHHLKEQNQTLANNTRHLTAENNQERALKCSYSLENTDWLVGMKVRSALLQLWVGPALWAWMVFGPGAVGSRAPLRSLLPGGATWALGTHLPWRILLSSAASSFLLYLLSSWWGCYAQVVCTDLSSPLGGCCCCQSSSGLSDHFQRNITGCLSLWCRVKYQHNYFYFHHDLNN